MSYVRALGIQLLVLTLTALSVSCVTADSSATRTDTSESYAKTVHPVETDDLLFNPGMGMADFHFGFGHPPNVPEEYPPSTVAYFRWTWADLEPEDGRYAFDFVDGIIAQAKEKGETLAFRIVTEYEKGTPAWLLDKGIESFKETDGTFPDYNNPTFLDYHDRLIKAFGTRYNGSPDIDHIDIGSVGCWGEWNTACCLKEQVPQCQALFPTKENQRRITEAYFAAFPDTPLVSLHGGLLRYGSEKGAGWRGDCFGDYGYFTPTWNHMEDAYEPVLKDPVIADAWKHGPVQFEVCGVVQDWYDKGFDLDRILQKGLDWHVSVLNAKSSPIPQEWRAQFDAFLKKVGYRIVLREIAHPARLNAGDTLVLRSRWDNVGVAPIYHPWPLAYRLRSAAGQVVAQWTSQSDLKRWLPGVRQSVEDRVVLPKTLASGSYMLEVAILDQAAFKPYVRLAIEGRQLDGWFTVSRIDILP
ncbi:beta-galactosidase [Nitrospira sp.]|nr:beta-galactosidase [Nitrospira sp.]